MFRELHYQQQPSNPAELPAASRYLIGGIIAALSGALIFALLTSGKAVPDIASLASAKLHLTGV